MNERCHVSTWAGERVCPVSKVDLVWHRPTARMLCRELNFKMPAQLSCRFYLAGLCIYVCVYYCDFPALFPAFLQCRWSQSPLTRLFLFKEWPQCLGICSCVDQVTQSIFFLSAERRLVLSWWLNGKYVTVSSTTLFAKLQISTTPLPG